jgi:hypothetical protein
MNKINYKNKSLEFEYSPTPKLFIDGELIEISRDEDANQFNSGELPYQSFDSLEQLAENVTDHILMEEQAGDGELTAA